ncbi:MAG TPA: hypothetical protein PKG52_05380 [bacterium]|nr:hypothetical protein [bacterium]
MIQKKQFLLISAVVYLFISFFHVYIKGIYNPNERIRFFMTHAIVSRGELSVNEEMKEFGNSLDKAKVGDKYYCDKAPMLSLLAVPAYFVYYKLNHGDVSESGSLRFLKLTQHSLFALLLFWLLFLYLTPLVKNNKLTLFFCFTAIFATPLFSFFTAYFSHSVAATLLFSFFFLLKNAVTLQKKWLFFFAGIVGGITFMTEYPLAAALSIISIFFFFKSRKKTDFISFLIGSGIVATLFFAYNTFVFGGPLSLGYSNLADKGFAVAQSKGLWGITFPKKEAVVQTLFSLRTGLFTLSPFMLFIFPAIWVAFRKKDPEQIIMIILIAVHFYLITGFEVWSGGGTFGSRHLVPVIPFISILAFRSFLVIREKLPCTNYLFVIFSILPICLFSLVLPFFSYFAVKFSNPLANFTLIMIRENFFPNSSILEFFKISNSISYAVWSILIIALPVYLMLLFFADFPRKALKTISMFLLVMSMLSLYFIPYAGKNDQLYDTYMSMLKNRYDENYELKKLTFQGKNKELIQKIEQKPRSR